MNINKIIRLLFISSAMVCVGVSMQTFAISRHFSKENECSSGPMFYAAGYASEYTNEPSYITQNQYTYNSMELGTTYKRHRGDGVKVAVIDSGINYEHEDFILNDNSVVKSSSRSIEYDSGWKYYNFSNYPEHLLDTLGHGTNVASVIASQINSLGCAGLAPNVELYVYKVTNSSNGYEWTAIQNALQYCIDNNMDVINMSFQAYEHEVTYGSYKVGASVGCSSILTSKLNACYEAGITLVAAAGNYNTSEKSYPASNNHVISVGSLAESSKIEKAAYSNLSDIDLVAPGTVYVADIGSSNSYKKTQGTSFSAPIVTAAIALYKQKNPTATPSQIEEALYASCDAIEGNPSWAGNGRLNLKNFINDGTDLVNDIILNNVDNGELIINVGDTFDIDYTVDGEGNFDDSVSIYPLMDEGVLSVDENGRITALSEGEDFIIIESNHDASIYAEIDVTVTDLHLNNISITGMTTNYEVGSDFFFDGTCLATYSNESTKEVTPTVISLPNMDKAGTYNVQVEYSEYGDTVTAEYEVVVIEPFIEVTSISLDKHEIELHKDDVITIEVTVEPDNATNKNFEVLYDDTAIEIVEHTDNSITIKAIGEPGNSTLTVKALDGSDLSDECSITILEDPIEPVDPIDPVDPADPTDPEDPVDPTEPEEPVDPVDPVDPTDPTDPEDPVDPVDPVDPADPTDPEEPVDPEDPTEPEEPEVPTEPTEPEIKTNGCGGSVFFSSTLLSILSLTGASLLIISKRKKRK